MIPKGTTLFPEWFDSSQMYYCDMPFAYWLGGNICEWVLYKEYNDYKSICHPNDCLCGISKEELLERFKTFSWYKEEDRENLCQAFRQRSLGDNEYNFEDFVYENEV